MNVQELFQTQLFADSDCIVLLVCSEDILKIEKTTPSLWKCATGGLQRKCRIYILLFQENNGDLIVHVLPRTRRT